MCHEGATWVVTCRVSRCRRIICEGLAKKLHAATSVCGSAGLQGPTICHSCCLDIRLHAANTGPFDLHVKQHTQASSSITSLREQTYAWTELVILFLSRVFRVSNPPTKSNNPTKTLDILKSLFSLTQVLVQLMTDRFWNPR
jgi:hypothetical protein